MRQEFSEWTEEELDEWNLWDSCRNPDWHRAAAISSLRQAEMRQYQNIARIADQRLAHVARELYPEQEFSMMHYFSSANKRYGRSNNQ